MRTLLALSGKVYAFLLRVALPSLGDACGEEAVAAFRELGAEARRRGAIPFLRFFLRETRALFSTVLEERRRERARARVESRKGRSLRSGGGRGMGFDHLGQDVRFAFRRFAGSPGFVLTAVFSLSLAIAVSTVAFSVVNAAFFRPIPHVADQDRLVRVFTSIRAWGRGPSTYPDFEDYRAMSGTMVDMAAMGSKNFSVGRVSEGTRQVWGLEVSENFFQFLGIPLSRGRGFLPEDVAAGGRVAVIGYNTWQRDFDGAADVLGRVIDLNGQPYTIVGVGPRGMVGPDGPMLLEIAVPLMEFREDRGRMSLGVLGRLREGVTIAGAQAEFDRIARSLSERYPDDWSPGGEGRRGLRVLPNQAARIPSGMPVAAVLGGLGALIGLIMLIACSNVANLLLTRAFRRRTEIAVRSSIGAPARRIFRELMVENLLLFGTAGGVGLLITGWLAALLASGGSVLPIPGFDFSVDWRVGGFALALALVTGVVFGLVPALQATRVDLLTSLKGFTPSARFRLLGIRNLLVAAQVGGSLVMVLVTLLLVQSLSRVRRLDLGFDPTGVATLSLDLSHRAYAEAEGRQFFRDLVGRTAALPGVEGVALASRVPLEGGSTLHGGLEPEGYEPGPDERVMAESAVITPGYLDVTRMRLLRGRDFDDGDRLGAPEVILVNQAFVDRFWPGEDGVGRRVRFGDGSAREVVGVVADVPYRDLSSEVGPQLWIPFGQSYDAEMVLHARTSSDPRTLLALMRQQVSDLDPNLPVIRADLMANISANATQPQRVAAAALGGTGLFTLCLAMLGIYGVVGYSVSQRTREMGLRMALGAEPGRVVRLVLREGLVLSVVGVVPGLLAAAAAARPLRAILMGLNPMDPSSFGLGTGLILMAVLGASLVPGVRAARTNPVESLRAE